MASERSGLGLSSSSTSGSALGGISSTLGISGRGARGSSIDRGRGRARGGLYHSSLGSYQRSTFGYDDETRGIGTRVNKLVNTTKKEMRCFLLSMRLSSY